MSLLSFSVGSTCNVAMLICSANGNVTLQICWVNNNELIKQMKHTRSQWLQFCGVLSIVEECGSWIGAVALSTRVLDPKCYFPQSGASILRSEIFKHKKKKHNVTHRAPALSLL